MLAIPAGVASERTGDTRRVSFDRLWVRLTLTSPIADWWMKTRAREGLWLVRLLASRRTIRRRSAIVYFAHSRDRRMYASVHIWSPLGFL
jgi:hypothetical protein